jgi:hypothetical protein
MGGHVGPRPLKQLLQERAEQRATTDRNGEERCRRALSRSEEKATDGEDQHRQHHVAAKTGQVAKGPEQPLGTDRIGRLADALVMHRRSLAARRKVFGGERPMIVVALASVARLSLQTSNSRNARPLAQEAAAMADRVFTIHSLAVTPPPMRRWPRRG